MRNVFVISREYPPGSTTGIAIYMKGLIDNVKSYFFYVVTYCRKYRTKNTETIQVWENKLLSTRLLSRPWFILFSILSSLRRDFDLIIGNALIGGICGVFIKFFKRKPLITMIYDLDFLRKESGVYGFFSRNVRKILFKTIFYFSDKIVVMSPFSKREVLSMSNLHPNQIEVVEAAAIKKILINKTNKKIYQKLRKEKTGPIIIFVGVIHPKKGLEYAIKAMPKIVKEIKNVSFYILGPPHNQKYYENLLQLVKKLKLQNNVKFLGRVENVNLWPYYKISDVYLAPSIRSDCFGMPIVEASDFGKPAIATRLFEENEVIINNKTGLVLPIKDSRAIENAVIKLLKNKKLREKLGRNAKKFSKKFNWQDSAKKLENVLNSEFRGE